MRAVSIWFLLFLAIAVSCEKDARVLPKEFPYVVTNDPVVSETGAVFSAGIVNQGDQKILKYGFIWKIDSIPRRLENARLFEGEINSDGYSYTLNAGLEKGKTYFVRAYILTDKYQVFGNVKSFVSQGSLPPVITAFSPLFGPVGTRVTVEGSNFTPSRSGNVVKLGSAKLVIDSVSENRILFTISSMSKPEKAVITVETAGMTATSENSFDAWFPWRKVNDFAEGYNGAVSFSAGGRAFIGLGWGITSLWEYDPSADKFTRKSDFPYPINADPVCFSIGSKGYVIFSSGNNHYPETSKISELWEYNPTDDNWSRKANFPGVNRNGGAAFSIGNKGYFGTGEIYDTYGYISYTSDFWEYDADTDNWTRKSDFPGSERKWSFGFSLGSNGYIGGGSTAYGQKSMYMFSQATDTWTSAGEYPGEGYNYLNGITINNKHYMGMGGENSGEAYSDFWEFNPAGNTWKKMRSCPLKMEPQMAVSINNKGYLGIGRRQYTDSDDFLMKVFEFDPTKN
jgi:N-acetylneuraminic acid mutarotase